MTKKQVALYARVSSEKQAEAGTIESQVAALKDRVKAEGHGLHRELEFVDDGYSGSTLIRPGLERLRDAVAAGAVDLIYVHSPDRLARKYAYQVLLIEEIQRAGAEVVFLNHQVSRTPEDDLLLQVQGVIAEYERAKIMERSRRGKLHAARRGSASVLTHAPYGYRFISKHDSSGEPGFEIVFEEARVVQQIFEWVGRERVSLTEVCRRLEQKGVRTRSGREKWDSSTVWGMLKNPAYMGSAAYGKTRITDQRQRLRPHRGAPEQPRVTRTKRDMPEDEWIHIPVPALISNDLFDSVQEQLAENRQRRRERQDGATRNLLSGLAVCSVCGYAYCAVRRKAPGKGDNYYCYYRCTSTNSRSREAELICSNKPIRADELEEAVWDQVRGLLEHPERLEKEHRRRMGSSAGLYAQELEKIDSQIAKQRRAMARLIDSYTEGTIEKEDFEPRMKRAKKELETLDQRAKSLADDESERRQLKLIIVKLAEFRAKVTTRLDRADRATKREIIATLVKRVEVQEDAVNVIFRIGANPFVPAPKGAFLQNCGVRGNAPLQPKPVAFASRTGD